MQRLFSRRLPKFLVFVLIFSLIFSYGSMALALENSYSVNHDIGEDTTYTKTYGTNTSGVQSVNIVEYSPNSGVTPMIAYGNKLYGTSTITAVANFLESAGHTVIAGINADFFDTSTGVPIGIVINEGEMISSNLGMPAIGFTASGKAIIGTPAQNMVFKRRCWQRYHQLL